jgi:thiamine-monophosphate kinase
MRWQKPCGSMLRRRWISDGLAGDFGKLCRASGVAADVVARVLLSEAARAVIAANPTRSIRAMGGDDYESSAHSRRPKPEASSRRRGCNVAVGRSRDQGR